MKTIAILNGPNLGRLGKREPHIYGSSTLQDLEKRLQAEAEALDVAVEFFQSNHEGALIDQIEKWNDAGVRHLIVNPGAFTHTSVALRDAIAGSEMSAIEVHLSNVHRREPFRQHSYTAAVCLAVISGLGFDGYSAALRHLAQAASLKE